MSFALDHEGSLGVVEAGAGHQDLNWTTRLAQDATRGTAQVVEVAAMRGLDDHEPVGSAGWP
jgi:hypothetical protein